MPQSITNFQRNALPAQWFASQCSSALLQLTSLNLHLWALSLQRQHFSLSEVARHLWLLSYPFSQLRMKKKLRGQLTCCLVQVRQIIWQLFHSNICNRAKYNHRSLKTSWKKNIWRKEKSGKMGLYIKDKTLSYHAKLKLLKIDFKKIISQRFMQQHNTENYFYQLRK